MQPRAEDADTDNALMASYSVFVVEPGTSTSHLQGERAGCGDCAWGPVWLLYLCIAFGILFVVMLVINLFLCSAMSCACSGHKDKEAASYLEDFDPYARSWQGSQYGSRCEETFLTNKGLPDFLATDTLTAIQLDCFQLLLPNHKCPCTQVPSPGLSVHQHC